MHYLVFFASRPAMGDPEGLPELNLRPASADLAGQLAAATTPAIDNESAAILVSPEASKRDAWRRPAPQETLHADLAADEGRRRAVVQAGSNRVVDGLLEVVDSSSTGRGPACLVEIPEEDVSQMEKGSPDLAQVFGNLNLLELLCLPGSAASVRRSCFFTRDGDPGNSA
eukprot:jgi/Mesen1/1167/ME000124S00202